MSTPTRMKIEVGIIALLVSGATAWGMFQAKVGQMETKLNQVDLRVQEIYCATVPETKRAGCR